MAAQLNLLAEDLDAAGDARRADYARSQARRLATCGRRAVMGCIKCGTRANEAKHLRCETRACGYCASAHADEVRDGALRAARAILASEADARVFVLTLTTRRPKGAPSWRYVAAAYELLSLSLPTLWRRLKRRGAIGAIGGMETGELGMVHVHVAVVGGWTDDERAELETDIREWWRKRTRVHPSLDEAYRVELALARGHAEGLPADEAFARAVRECVAYIVGASARPGECDRPALARLGALSLAALCGRRRLRAYGAFYGVELQEEREPGCDDDAGKPAECDCCGGRVFRPLYVLDDDEPFPPTPPAGVPELRGLSPGGP